MTKLSTYQNVVNCMQTLDNSQLTELMHDIGDISQVKNILFAAYEVWQTLSLKVDSSLRN